MKSFVSLIYVQIKSSLLLSYLVTQSLTLWILEMLTHLKKYSLTIKISDSYCDHRTGSLDINLQMNSQEYDLPDIRTQEVNHLELNMFTIKLP